jgi:SNF2 family DNA or RNA helicase
MDELDDIGRIVIYAGFQGSIDKVIAVVKEAGWNYVKADGRGWVTDTEGDGLENFTQKLTEYPKMAFIGQPGAAGMGLNLQVSPMIVYYSNSFNGEDRKQSMNRCQRPGMDKERGCTIVDFVHLPTDQLVLDNLEKKDWLQKLTMGAIQQCLINQR